LLTDRGFNVYGFDLRGHGRSGRLLGYVPTFESLVSDLLQVVSWVRFKSQRKKPILVGHGLGALITIYFANRYHDYVQGAVLTSPCFNQATLGRFGKMAIKAVAELLPTLRLPKRVTPAFMIFETPAGSSQARKYHGITVQFAKEVLVGLQGYAAQFQNYSLPTLLLYPRKDNMHKYEDLTKAIEVHPYREFFETHIFEDDQHCLLTHDEGLTSRCVDLVTDWIHREFKADMKMSR
jgi:alpha-beta hydrolase superfamily lysophospholipase